MSSADREDVLRQLAALHALGALPEEEASEFERRLARDEGLRREVAELREVSAEIGFAGASGAPDPGLKERLLSRIGGDDVKSACPPEVVRGGEGEFEPSEIDGVAVRWLSRSADGRNSTFLLRCEPGVRFPSHGHVGREECFVLEGDLSVGDDVELVAGDYQVMEPQTVHAPLRTRRGCLLFIAVSAAS